MADGAKSNNEILEDGETSNHPFAVAEEVQRSAFTVVSKGQKTSARGLHSSRNPCGVHEAIQVIDEEHRSSNREENDAVSYFHDQNSSNGTDSNHRKVIGRLRSDSLHNSPSRTKRPSGHAGFPEPVFVKPVHGVEIRGDAIGPGVVVEGPNSSQYGLAQPDPHSRDEFANGRLRNRGNRRQEANIPCNNEDRGGYSNRNNNRQCSKSNNSSHPSILSGTRSVFANRHRLSNDQELLSRPSWCDAKFAHDQILQGKASGNKRAVRLRSVLHRFLFTLGCRIQRRAGFVLLPSLILLTACAVGLKNRELETRVEKLWVESGGVLEKELEYTRKYFGEEMGTSSLLLIQVGEDTASIPSLQLHLKAAVAATKVTITAYEQDWSLSDLCHKEIPEIGEVPFSIEQFMHILFPCLIMGPLDCFFEGAELLGPATPLPESNFFGISIPSISWKTLDPIEIIEPLMELIKIDIKSFSEITISSGVEHGYTDRWCLDPNNPECPSRAPNHNTKQDPDVKRLLTKGCEGYAKNYMKWPNDLIIGGTQKDDAGNITRVRGLQTLFHLMGPANLYNFYQNTMKVDNNWSLDRAKNIITLWQRKFFQEMYNIEVNSSMFDGKPDKVHAFTPSTAEDLILEFSNFSVVRVAAGYLLMLVYACITMLRCKASRSQGAVGIVGVLLVALSVMAGLGICSVLQIKFNAATTQVLPFLMLGLGVDDMFLIAHQFGEIACLSFIDFEERTGECLKRVGVSVCLTSVALICGFLFSMIIPMPALRSFAMQAAIVTCFNIFCVLVVFPAALSLDLQRRKKNKLDIFCCFQSSSANDVVALSDYGRDASPPRMRQTPDVQYINAPVGVHHPQMDTEATFTMHQTIQAFSNDSYVTFVSPQTGTLYNPSNVPVNVIRPDISPTQPRLPLTPPPMYTPGAVPIWPSPPEPPQTPRYAFQEHVPSHSAQKSRQQPPHRESTRPHSSTVSSSRAKQRSHRTTTSNLVTPMESVRSSTHSLVPVGRSKKWSCWKRNKSQRNSEYSQRIPFITLSAFAKKYYGPFLMKKSVKITVLVMCCLLFGGSIYGCVTVRDGLDFVDIFPRGTREHAAISAQLEYFSFYHMYLVSKDFDYAHRQKELHMLHQNISDLKHVVRNTDGTKTKFWLEIMRDWLQNLMNAFDEDWSRGHINETTWRPSASDEGKLAFRLLMQTGKAENSIDKGRIGCAPPFSKPCPKVNIVRLVSDDGIIREDAFYNYLTAWYHLETLAYMASQAEIVPTPETWPSEAQGNLDIPRSKAITYAQMPYYLNGLKENDDFVEAIESVRNLCDYYELQGVKTYPSGYPFLFWQQYIDLRQWLFVALGASILAISAVISLVLLSLWAGAITCLFLLIISTEMLGFMGIVGVKLSALPAVILISVVGLGVEFTVHITLAFITSCGSREDRTKAAISHMMGPVVDGAVSTFLGVVMLSGSEFDFIVRYFFQVLAAMVVIGLWNGVVVLPIVLSMIGPRPEVTPRGGGSRLKTPTPPPTPPNEENENVCPNCNNSSSGGRFARPSHPYVRYSSRDDVSYMPHSYPDESHFMRGSYYPPYRFPHSIHHAADPRSQCQVNPGYSSSNGNSGSSTPRAALADGRVYICQPDVVLYSQRQPDLTRAQHCDSPARGSQREASSNRNDQSVAVGDKTPGSSGNRTQHIATVTSSITLKVLHAKNQPYSVQLAKPAKSEAHAKDSNAQTDSQFKPIPESQKYGGIHVPSYQETLRNDRNTRHTTSNHARISPNVDLASEVVDSAFSELSDDHVIA